MLARQDKREGKTVYESAPRSNATVLCFVLQSGFLERQFERGLELRLRVVALLDLAGERARLGLDQDAADRIGTTLAAAMWELIGHSTGESSFQTGLASDA